MGMIVLVLPFKQASDSIDRTNKTVLIFSESDRLYRVVKLLLTEGCLLVTEQVAAAVYYVV